MVCLALSVVAGVGVAVVAYGMSGLRWAHLSRQRSGEGLAFFWIGLELLAGGALAALAALGLAVAAKRLNRRSRIIVRTIAGVVALSLTTCAVIAIWVEGHGGDCVRSCG